MADERLVRALANVPRRCPACRARIAVPAPGGLAVRRAVLRVSAQTARAAARCPRCRGWVEVLPNDGE
jgi:DNA-directed RNA polymerase subunit RPC12/RpoP